MKRLMEAIRKRLFPEFAQCPRCGRVGKRKEMVKGYPGRFCTVEEMNAYHERLVR